MEVPADLPEISIDVDQLQHALQNLLDNALAYTPHGGRITIGARRAGDRIALAVADTGRGIPAKYLPSIFEKYFRVPGSSVPGGSGLGLAHRPRNRHSPRRHNRMRERAG